jgi:N-acetylmuramoyl-L-alanine amidase
MSRQSSSVVKTAFVPEPDHLGTTTGDGAHPVQLGECMSSIAYDTGHFWETLWNLDANKELRDTRKDPNVLLTGDHVEVPPIKTKKHPCAIDKRHRFRRRGVPEKLRIRLMNADEPRADEPYTLIVDNDKSKRIDGVTDANGCLETWIPPNAKTAVLFVHDGEFELELGQLPPPNTIEGAIARLVNLGFLPPGETSDNLVRCALGSFQLNRGIPVTHAVDDQTALELEKSYKDWEPK